MNLIRTSIISFFTTITKMLSGLVINKAISIFIGPIGLALLGQFHNFFQIISTIAQGAINSGVTKYSAEYLSNEKDLFDLFRTSIRISLFSAIGTGFVVLLFSRQLSCVIFDDSKYFSIFIVLSFTLVLFVLNNLIISVLNGIKDIKTWAKINIIQNACSLILTSILVAMFGLYGALLALVTNQSIVFFFVLLLLKKHRFFKLDCFWGKVKWIYVKKLLNYSFMGLTTAVVMPLSHFFVRRHIAKLFSWEEAGYWQAIIYVSNIYLTIATTTLSTYYLPRISEIRKKNEIRRELKKGYLVLIPITIFSSLFLYVLRENVTKILFSKEFLGMQDLFLWHMIGNIIKIASYLLAYIMLGKAMTKLYVITEIVFAFLFVGFTFLGVQYFGIVGTSYAYAINYLIYFLTMIYGTRKYWL